MLMYIESTDAVICIRVCWLRFEIVVSAPLNPGDLVCTATATDGERRDEIWANNRVALVV